MEKTIESDRTNYSFAGLEEEIIELPTEAHQYIRTAPRSFEAARIYAKPLGGIAAMLALLVLPALTMPGLVIFVLIGEIYLIDWTYSKFSEARGSDTKPAETETLEKDARPEDEIDKIASRSEPKNQFIK